MKLVILERAGLSPNISRLTFALIIAAVFHAAGIVGNLFFASPFISHMTPVHLLLMAFLSFYVVEEQRNSLILFAIIAAVLGFAAELIGVHTALLFGHYQYGPVLGPAIAQVPVLIGVNWFLVLAGAATVMQYIARGIALQRLRYTVIVFGAAALATFLDWVLEPVAIALGYWRWLGNDIPLYNYWCWFLVSLVAMIAYVITRPRTNAFHAWLYILQLLFFAALRLFLPA